MSVFDMVGPKRQAGTRRVPLPPPGGEQVCRFHGVQVRDADLD